MIDLANVDFNDLSNARIFLSEHGRDLRYWLERGKWLYWNGAHWELDKGDQVKHRAYSIGKAFKEALKHDLSKKESKLDESFVDRVRKWASTCGNKGRIDAMISLAAAFPTVVVTSEEIDADPWLVNTANGTYDLKMNTLYPHDRDNLITTCTDVDYDPESDTGPWFDMIMRVCRGREDLSRYLQVAAGYSLTQSVKEQCLFICYGTGSNGKTTFLETLQNALGGYASTAQMSSFASAHEGPDKPRPDLLRLKNKRMIVVNEPDAGRALAEGLIKQLTGGDKIVAREMHQSQYFEFSFRGKIWIACNSRPTVKGSDLGIWRRLQMVPFDAVFRKTDADFDPDLPRRIMGDLPAVLLWAIEGAKMWRSGGLPDVKEVDGAKFDYQMDQDILHDFINDKTIIDSDAFVLVNDLYREYADYCDKYREKAVGKRTFSMRLVERGFKKALKTHKRLQAWDGVRLAGDWECIA